MAGRRSQPLYEIIRPDARPGRTPEDHLPFAVPPDAPTPTTHAPAAPSTSTPPAPSTGSPASNAPTTATTPNRPTDRPHERPSILAPHAPITTSLPTRPAPPAPASSPQHGMAHEQRDAAASWRVLLRADGRVVLPSSSVWMALALVVALMVFAYVVGYQLARPTGDPRPAQTDADNARLPGPGDLPREPTPAPGGGNLNDNSSPPDENRPDLGDDQNRGIDLPDDGSAIAGPTPGTPDRVPVPRPESIAIDPNQPPEFVGPTGALAANPMRNGHNHLRLATMSLQETLRTVAFLTEEGVDAVGVRQDLVDAIDTRRRDPNNPLPYAVMVVSPSFPSPMDRSRPEVEAARNRVLTLGKLFKQQSRLTDFSGCHWQLWQE